MKDDNASVKRLLDEISAQGFVDAIGDAVSIQSTDFRVLYQNQAHKDIIGDHLGEYCYEAYERRGERCEGCPVALSLADGRVHKEERSALINGEMIRVEITASALRDKRGKIVAGIEVVRDITRHVETRERLVTQALTDELTGLYNRRGFITLVEHQLKILKRTNTGVLLLFADVNRLKWINDEFGHREGDRVLKETADVLRDVFRESDIIARMGGDEFVVFLPENSDTNAALLHRRFQKYLDAHNAKRERDYDLSISIGITHHEGGPSQSIDDLLHQADQLMYQRKKGETA